MDKQDWTPKLRDEVWLLSKYAWGIDGPYEIGEIHHFRRGNEMHLYSGRTLIEDYVPASSLFPTRELAKAALIEKLEQALEEAKRL